MKKTYFIAHSTAKKHLRITQAIKTANEEMDAILEKTGKLGRFHMSDVSGAYVAKKIREFKGQMVVKIYYTKNPFSNVLGYYSPARPWEININGRNFNRSRGSLVATMVHELVHAVDDADLLKSYGHGSNTWTKEKEATAPYLIDNVAESHVDKVPLEKLPESSKQANSRIKNVRTVWYKPWTWFNRIIYR